MRAGFGCVQRTAGDNAESQGGNGRERECCDDSQPNGNERRAGCLIFVVGALGDGKGEAQIVGGGKAGVEQADDGQDDGASADGGGEGVELAEEAAGEGNSNQRDQEKDEQAAEQGER